MTLPPGIKFPRIGIFLLLVLVAAMAIAACRSEPAPSSEVALVWEAWDLVKSSYVAGADLDSEEVTGGAIMGMLDAAQVHPYPFLLRIQDARGRPPVDVPRELADVWRAWTLFQDERPGVSAELLVEGALDGMLDSLPDDSVARLTPEAYDRARERLLGTYQGIGAYVDIQESRMVLFPMSESPAERAGIEAGDVLLEVGGEPVEGKSLQEAVERVRGPEGSRVTLLVEREGETEPLEFDVSRGDIDMESAQPRLLPGGIGYIWISDFQENTPDEVLDILDDFKRLDALALILDLRSNSGISVEAAQEVASQFLAEGQLFMYEVDGEGERRNWPVQAGGAVTGDLPMVVMVNELTGSAAEVVAGALQDHNRAPILGARTLGMGSANVYKELNDGSALYLPVSHWYTPLGNLIQGEGIAPDIEVLLTDDDRAFGVDVQLRAAYDHLDDQLPAFR